MWLGAALWAQVAVSAVLVVLWMAGRIGLYWGAGLLAIGNAVIFVAEVASSAWVGAVINGLITAGCAWTAWDSWRHRRRRRRAPRTLGAKSRARIAAMVTRMRERPSRPVLRPVPGGAR